jgi:prepilin-type N-terminal cleavage/methylation domain-containing protein
MAKGFTFIELLIVISLVLIVSVPASIFSFNFMSQMAVRDAAEYFSGAIREAQSLAMSGKDNASWGVHYENSSHQFILFRGDSFSGRDTSFDEAMEINHNITVTGFSETIFSVSDGRPNQTFSAARISWGNSQEFFTLNSEGVIE